MSTGRRCDSWKTVWLPSLHLGPAGEIGQSLALSGFKPGPVVRCGFHAVRRDAAMTDRILEFLRNRHEEGPCLVLDLDVERDDMRLLPIKPREHR
jgi:hypothetical protein